MVSGKTPDESAGKHRGGIVPPRPGERLPGEACEPRPDYYLVRVSREMVDALVADDSAPVVIVRVVEQPDGTHDMHLRTPEASP